MKKLILIAICCIGCNEFQRGKFFTLFRGKYKANFVVNKNTNKEIEFIDSIKTPEYSFSVAKLSIKIGSEIKKFETSLDFDLTDRNSKKRIWDRNVYYSLVDSTTFKVYSLKVRGVSTNGQNADQLEIGNIIEGKYDQSKDTLVYKCSKIM